MDFLLVLIFACAVAVNVSTTTSSTPALIDDSVSATSSRTGTATFVFRADNFAPSAGATDDIFYKIGSSYSNFVQSEGGEGRRGGTTGGRYQDEK